MAISPKQPAINDPTSEAARRNITRVTQLESDYEERRSSLDRVVARIASYTGSLKFLSVHTVWFLVWIALNSGIGFHHPFDPYPFPLLSMIVSCEAVLLSTIVLIEQNWMNRRDERREHLHLQVNLLAEQEITKVLHLQRLICKRLGIVEAERDTELMELVRETQVEKLAEEVENALDPDPS
jgi:uncharacterized membrane protein